MRAGLPFKPLSFNFIIRAPCTENSSTRFYPPITFNNNTHSISVYADDILLFSDKAVTSIPHILVVFEEFGSLSGYKINWSKSALFPLNSKVDPRLLPQRISVFKQFQYLEVDIFPSLASIANNNFTNIYNKIEADLDRWPYLPK